LGELIMDPRGSMLQPVPIAAEIVPFFDEPAAGGEGDFHRSGRPAGSMRWATAGKRPVIGTRRPSPRSISRHRYARPPSP
jgi:hypothetical protein